MAESNFQSRNPIFFMAIRLAIIFTAATCLFRGIENWRNDEYAEAVVWFLLSSSQIGQLFGFFNDSKIARLAIWIPLILAVILSFLRKLF